MSDILESIGIKDSKNIEKYTLRQEGSSHVLKVYYKKEKGDLWARSEKYKFPAEKRQFKLDSASDQTQTVFELSETLANVLDVLDRVSQREGQVTDVKAKILADLRHLERVVANKIAEIESDLDKL